MVTEAEPATSPDGLTGGFTFKTKDKKEIDSRMDEFLEKANIKLLSDDIECINNEFYLIGRIDYSTAQKSKGSLQRA